MPERSNGLPWKGSISERVSRVRIPLFPPSLAEAASYGGHSPLVAHREGEQNTGEASRLDVAFGEAGSARSRASVQTVAERQRGDYQ